MLKVGFHPSPKTPNQRGNLDSENIRNILIMKNLEAEVGIAPRSPSPAKNSADFAA